MGQRHIKVLALISALALLNGDRADGAVSGKEEGSSALVPPNILIILADDLSWFDIGCYGSEDVQTPNIDRLAREGMLFENAFTATAMCAPTRQQLYTGLFPVRSGAMANHSQVKAGTKSLVHHLGDLGYRVHLQGKKHFGPTESFPFEHPKKLALPSGPDPFCLVVASGKPHNPWPEVEGYDPETLKVPPYLIDNVETRTAMARYFTEITQLDETMGRLLDELEESDSADNTLVIFTSEQGSAFFGGKWTCYDRGLKTAFIARWPGKIEAGSRSEALVQYVDVVPTLIEVAGGDPLAVDTGRDGAPDGGRGFDGKSFLEVLTGARQEHHEFVYGVHTMQGAWFGGPFPIRSVRDNRYKLIWNPMHERDFANFLMVEDKLGCWRSWLRDAAGDPKAAEIVQRWEKRPEFEFYDTEKDPFELRNLIDEPEHQGRVAALRAQLEGWMTQQGDRGIETELSNAAYVGPWNDREVIR